MKIILEGVVGSVAYGLNTSESDIDTLGIMVYPTEKILSLCKGKETIHSTNPDYTYHEFEKFIRLASRCNPSALELLYLTEYTKQTIEGEFLLDIRDKFLSKIIYKSYGGYALSQAKKLKSKTERSQPDKRHAKHARHCFRLLYQGKELLKTGKLTVRVSDVDKIIKISEMPIEKMLKLFEQEFEQFDSVKTNIPDTPDYEVLNELLLKIRSVNYEI